MAIVLAQTKTAVAPYITASFAASGGMTPYVYSVVAGGAGGAINSSSGLYTAPSSASSDPDRIYDTIRVTDAIGGTSEAQILVGSPIILFCEILSREMPLAMDRIWLWDQRIPQPTDSDLYLAVSNPFCRPFANINRMVAANDNPESGLSSEQFIVTMDTLDIDVISRGPAARDRKFDVLLALKSNYAAAQMASNSFGIGFLSMAFRNLSQADGAAIPYRYKVSVNIQYSYSKALAAVDYFNNNFEPTILINP